VVTNSAYTTPFGLKKEAAAIYFTDRSVAAYMAAPSILPSVIDNPSEVTRILFHEADHSHDIWFFPDEDRADRVARDMMGRSWLGKCSALNGFPAC
jgi:hypothetical protein